MNSAVWIHEHGRRSNVLVVVGFMVYELVSSRLVEHLRASNGNNLLTINDKW